MSVGKLATVTVAGCTGIIISTTIPTTTSTSCKGFGAMNELRIIPCNAVKKDLRLLAEALFLPGIPLDRICIFVQPRVGSRQGKTEDYVHYAGILFVRKATICTSGRLTDSFRELYGLLFWASIALSRNSSDD